MQFTSKLLIKLRKMFLFYSASFPVSICFSLDGKTREWKHA